MTGRLAALLADEGLPDAYRDTVDRWWRPLADVVAARRQALGRPLVVGVNGPQGSGKSTLCRVVELLLADAHGLRAVTLSIDDLYLARAERLAKADQVHPLFATRGPPGTHDVYLGLKVIADLLSGKPAHLPRFNKGTDDRAPGADWPEVAPGVDVVLFEGWCVGLQAQDGAALDEPVNALEAAEDGEGRWRAAVNAELGETYPPLFRLIDLLVLLAAPGFEQVLGWRTEQERKLVARTGQGMDDAAVARFVQHYERLTRHGLDILPGRADAVVALDAERQVTGLSGPAAPPAG